MRLPWNRKETDLDREVRYHLDALADGFERQGLSRAEAVKRARREFGGVDQVKEQCRDERRWRPLAQLGQDLTFGVRMLRKTPAVTAAAVLSLALGIGATTAILSLVDAVLWRTLAIPEPQQLTEVLWEAPQRPEGLFRGSSGSMFKDGAVIVADFFSRDAYRTFRTRMAGRADVAAHTYPDDVSTSYAGVTAVARLRPVSGNFFTMLGVQPAAGRLLSPADDDPAAPLAIVVSDFFWRRSLQGDAAAVGRTLRLNNRAYAIAGVLPRRFAGIATGDSTDLYVTIEHSPSMLNPESFERRASTDPSSWWLQLLARRNGGRGIDPLRAEMDALFRSTWAAEPTQAVPTVRLQDAAGGIGSLRRELGSPLTLLFALVGLVLLIACANIANLLLARADTRRKEVALRLSLGCTRARLTGQFFTESALLAVLGGVLSLGVAYATANFAVTLMPGDLRLDFQIDGRMILATLAVTAFTALVFGLYPAWRASRMDTAPALKEGWGSVGGARHGWVTPGKILVFTQVAVGVALVAAAGTFTAHLRKIVTRDTGFERTRLLLFDLRPGESGYRGDRLRQFYLRLEDGLREVPGAQSIGLARVRPMRGGGHYDDVMFAGVAKPVGSAVNFVTAGYFEALGIPIVVGRSFTAREVRAGTGVAVVSEDFAKALGRSPLGMMLRREGEEKQLEVVGIAGRARYSRMTDDSKVLYVPNGLDRDTITAVVRTSVPPLQVLAGVRKAVAGLDANLPVVQPVTMEEQIAMTLRRERLFAWLCGAFGVLALVLCMIGLYGVMSYATARRRQEIGIRMALGASPARVLRHVVGEGVGMALAGCVLGAPAAWWAARRFVDYKRLGMDPVDPSILAWATAALAASALLAVLGPAVRAASADPVKALREG